MVAVNVTALVSQITRSVEQFARTLAQVLGSSGAISSVDTEPLTRAIEAALARIQAESVVCIQAAERRVELFTRRELNALQTRIQVEAPIRSGRLASSISAGPGIANALLHRQFFFEHTQSVDFFVQIAVPYAVYAYPGDRFHEIVDAWLERYTSDSIHEFTTGYQQCLSGVLDG